MTSDGAQRTGPSRNSAAPPRQVRARQSPARARSGARSDRAHRHRSGRGRSELGRTHRARTMSRKAASRQGWPRGKTALAPRTAGPPKGIRRAWTCSPHRAPRRPRRSPVGAVLCALLIALAFAYAYPVRSTRSRRRSTPQDVARSSASGYRHDRRTGQWNDDDYVMPSRTRFQLVRRAVALCGGRSRRAQSGTRILSALFKSSVNVQEIDARPPVDHANFDAVRM